MADIAKWRPNLCRSLARMPKTRIAYDNFVRSKRGALKGYVPGLDKDRFNDEAKCLGCDEVLCMGCELHTTDQRCMCVVLCDACDDN